MTGATQFRHRVIDAVTMLLVSGVSLVLLMYVGFGEGQRTYQKFYVEKVTAQAKIVQSALERYLRPGLPLAQYAGFKTRAAPIVESDRTIAALTIFDRVGKRIFTSGDTSIPLLPKESGNRDANSGAGDVRHSDEFIQVVLPLQNRFEVAGHLAVTMPRSVVVQRVEEKFRPVLLVAGMLSLVFAIFVAASGRLLSQRRWPWLQIVFATVFLAMSGTVITTLVSLYSEGAQAKTKVLADSLGQRLSDLIGFNLNLGGIYGLDRTFDEYLKLNPDISAAGLTVDGKVTIHTDKSLIGKNWVTQSRTYEYVVDLATPNSSPAIRVAVAIPADIVYRQIARSVKNFAALFIASAFLAGVFLQIAGATQRLRSRQQTSTAESGSAEAENAALSLVKPVFFIAVLAEHLTYSFLPQYVESIVIGAGLAGAYLSAPFVAFYLCFAIALLPAGHFAQHYSARPLMFWGLILAAGGLLALALPLDIYAVILARSLSGIGQGMLFIGVQSYILNTASPDRKTQGAGIIVFGFQGGMISGMAVGSLLVSYIGASGVFILAGSVALLISIYAISAVPKVKQRVEAPVRTERYFAGLAQGLFTILRNWQFLKTMFFIGIPAKAVMTGVIIFALPLLLTQMKYAQEDIGQIIMVYAAAVVLSSGYASRFSDRYGQTHTILFLGAVISGIGLALLGVIGEEIMANSVSSRINTILFVFGVAVIGAAHGLINAPVITHVGQSMLAQRVGDASLTATYRFLERIGHAAGPVIVGQLFLTFGQQPRLLLWMGTAIAVCGILFAIAAEQRSPMQDKGGELSEQENP